MEGVVQYIHYSLHIYCTSLITYPLIAFSLSLFFSLITDFGYGGCSLRSVAVWRRARVYSKRWPRRGMSPLSYVALA